jgi:hypothetical protein
MGCFAELTDVLVVAVSIRKPYLTMLLSVLAMMVLEVIITYV